MGKPTRVYFTCDIHGSEQCFRKFLNVAKYNIYSADVMILSGDLTGKALVAIIEDSKGQYEIRAKGFECTSSSSEELEKAKMRIRNQGFYPKVFLPDEFTQYSEDASLGRKALSELIGETIQQWVSMAEERLKGVNIPCYIMPGNDDELEIDSILARADRIVNPEGKVVQLDQHHEMISSGYTNPTPWKTSRECSEEELSRRIGSLTAQVKDMKNCVFNFHAPPFDSTLDSAPLLDENLRPQVTAGELLKVPVGSKSVRSAIESHQPLLGLHGHIHESSGIIKIGRTKCFNAGSEYQQGILRGVLVDLEPDKIVRELRVQG